jgi:hypothetical protein
MFQVRREDGSKYVAIEVTTFLIPESGYRRAIQIEWFLGGKSLMHVSTVTCDPDARKATY